ncbi:MAG TPA: SDR family NAD(P)-dependent oxidoreductase [Steroidobacteraceae bacterium]|nr:SDR family NAD(P)-dependent oxidoreductase [Steroidobacteraceae bacterium]
MITGASRGLGKALAERFAAEGATLVLVARTSGALEEVDDRVRAAGARATLVPLDLADGQAIDQLGGVLAQRFGRLDVLVGCAAELGPLSPLGHLKPQAFERVMAVNATANYRLIRSLDPLLRAAPAGRALFVTCAQARARKPYWGGYAASKAALETLVVAYAAETRRTALRVNLIDPGVMRTRLRASAYPGEDASKLPDPRAVTEALVALAETACDRHGCLIEAADGQRVPETIETRTPPSRNPTETEPRYP